MEALATRVDEAGNRQLQLTEDDVLLGDGQGVRLDQRKAELRDVLVLHACAVYGIKPDPCTGFRFPVTDRRADIVLVLLQGGDELTGSPVIDTLAWYPLVLLVFPDIIRHVGHAVIHVE